MHCQWPLRLFSQLNKQWLQQNQKIAKRIPNATISVLYDIKQQYTLLPLQ
jgi:hypothetical protein